MLDASKRHLKTLPLVDYLHGCLTGGRTPRLVKKTPLPPRPTLKPVPPKPKPKPAVRKKPPPNYRKQFTAIESQRMSLCLRSEDAAFQVLAGRTAEIVIELAAEVGESGSRFVVMLIPDQYQVDQHLFDEILSTTGSRRDDYDVDRPQRVLGSALRSAGIEVLDLLPVFRQSAAGGGFYRPQDTHWNRRGSELAATHLAKLLAPDGVFGGSALFFDGLESGRPDAWSSAEVH